MHFDVFTLFPGLITPYLEESILQRARANGLLRVDVNGATIEALGKARVGDHVLVCLRPEDLVIRLPGDRGAQESARNRLEGVVEDAMRLEAQYPVQISCGPQVVALVTKQSFEEMGLAPGTPMVVTFKAWAAHLIRH